MKPFSVRDKVYVPGRKQAETPGGVEMMAEGVEKCEGPRGGAIIHLE